MEPGAAATGKPRARRPSHLALGLAFACVFALQVYLVFNKSVNWDEFYHFSLIRELRSGTLTQALQVFFIRPLAWVAGLPLPPIDQLLVGRLFVLLCTPVTAFAIYGLARRFTEREPALLCALAYVTAGYVFLHSFAFRADGPATAALMLALWLYASRQRRLVAATLIGLLLAVAAMITVKSIFYAPAFAGIFALRLTRGEGFWPLVGRGLLILVLAALFFALLFLWHGSGLAVPAVQSGQGTLQSAGSTVFSNGLFPRSDFAVRQVILAPAFVLLLLGSLALWHRRLTGWGEVAAMVGFLAPLVTILVYRNAFPYYYVFILAPVTVALFPAVEWLLERIRGFGLAIILLVQVFVLTIQEPVSVLAAQRSVSAAAHRIFPHPVAYVDHCGILGDFPRVFPFLTNGWGLRSYRDGGRALLADRLAREPVPLVIVNHPVIAAALAGRPWPEQFLPEDAALLRENYIWHWGPIWVAGKTIRAGSKTFVTTVATAGPYTLEGASILLDGRQVEPGQVVQLARGPHLVGPDPDREARLRWGAHLLMPHERAPVARLYTIY